MTAEDRQNRVQKSISVNGHDGEAGWLWTEDLTVRINTRDETGAGDQYCQTVCCLNQPWIPIDIEHSVDMSRIGCACETCRKPLQLSHINKAKTERRRGTTYAERTVGVI